MTPTETARVALQKALEALDNLRPIFVEQGEDISAIVDAGPARRVIEQALAELPAEEPPTASMDTKALEIASRLIAALVSDVPIARYKEAIQMAILEGMRWMRSQDREPETMRDERMAFEAWADSDSRDITPLDHEERTVDNGLYYAADSTNQAYIGWRERSASAKCLK